MQVSINYIALDTDIVKNPDIEAYVKIQSCAQNELTERERFLVGA